MTLVRIILFLNFSFFTAVLSTGCLDTSSSKSKSSASTSTTNPSTTPSPKDLGFAGVKSVKNLDASTIEISWDQVDSTRLAEVSGYRVYELSATGEMTPLIQLPNFFGSYYHSVTEGTYHIYMVRVIDKDGLADSNSITKSALAYKGITSVTNVGSTTATVNFPAGGFATGGVKIYAISRGETKTFTASSITATSYDLTGLRSGSSYTFNAKALIKNGTSGAEDEDANSLTVSKQTTALTKTNYQGPLLVQAFGAASGAPSGTPYARQVRLTWLPFISEATGQNYRVIRVKKDGEINTITTKDCGASVIDSCVVCTVTVDLNNASPRTCTDTNVDNVVGSAPVYDYVVVLASSTDWPEELLPSSDDTDTVKLKKYRITAHIPPDNMVLVHRDSANYEMCSLMGKTSDPFNHQRCSYSGLGALPSEISAASYPDYFDAGNPRYYDFGYNLFVDRWEAGCNWSSTGTADPSGGNDGDVYYRNDAGVCFVKEGTWKTVADITSTSSREKSYTITPDTTRHKPPLVNIDQTDAYNTCNAITDLNYGKKRLLRKREFVVAAAWASTRTDEPEYISNTSAIDIENDGDRNGSATNSRCNTDLTKTSYAYVDFSSSSGYELSRGSGGGPDSFTIGSSGTKKCISRFGAQDLVGNVWEWTSDQLSSCDGNHSCMGGASSLDSNNSLMSNISFDGVVGPGGGSFQVTEWLFDATSLIFNGDSYANFFSIPFGTSLVNNDNGNAIQIQSGSTAIIATRIHGDKIYLYTDNYPNDPDPIRGFAVGGSWSEGAGAGRWASDWRYKKSVISSERGFRCALSAN